MIAGGRSLIVVGLDGAEPSLVFGAWRDDLPTIGGLMARGTYGRLESTIPAITVPAWSSMMTGLDPGQLGLYGFRNRTDRSYDRLTIANGASIDRPRVWDVVGGAGGRVGVVSVPQTYPVRPVNGHLVSCFLTPGPESRYAYPLGLKGEIEDWIDGPLLVDVPDFRSDDKERILRDIYRMADQHFEICRRLLRRERYDFFMTVDMGVDRIHHALWKAMDPQHPHFVPGHPLASAIHDYYIWVDLQLRSLLELTPDDAIVVVVSDHGGQAMQGGLCVNEWLRSRGDLVTQRYPDAVERLDECHVDWPATRVWGDGGYYGRVFMNVAGREPFGRIAPTRYEEDRSRLAEQIASIRDPAGGDLGTRVFRPEEIYREVRNVAPDLIVYFGDLTWRSVGSLGHRSLWTFENDTGPDDANHAQHGIFVLYDPRHPDGGRELTGLHIHDVGPTLLTMLGLPIPEGVRGRPIPELVT